MNWTFAYVALVYFSAVFLWRIARRNELPWRVAVFFYLLVLLFLFRPLTQSYVNVPADYLSTIPPWRAAPIEAPVQNPEINDVILQMVPWAHQVREAWKSGEAPTWNAAAGSGYPLLANGQSAAFSPLRFLALPLSLGNGFTAEAAFKFLIGLTATFLYLRRRRFSMIASLAGGVSFGFSTYVVVWLHFPHSTVTAFLPVIFLALDLLFEKINYPRFALMAFAFTAMLLGGHPESAAHSSFVAGLYVIYLLITSENRWQKLGALAAASFVAILLSLPFLLPFFETLPRTQRFDWLNHKSAASYSANYPSFVLLFQPDFFGRIADRNHLGPGFAEMICGSAGVLGIGGWFIVLAALRRKEERTRLRIFYLASMLLIASIALAWPFVAEAFEQLPLFSMAANSRLRLVTGFLGAILAAMAIDIARRDHFAAMFGVAAMTTLFAFAFALPQLGHGAGIGHAVFSSVPAFATLLLVAMYALAPRARRVIAIGILISVVGEMFAFGINWNATVPATKLFARTPLLNRLLVFQQQHRRSGGSEPFRIAGSHAMFFPNSAGMYGLEDIRAHDPMAFGKFLGVLRAFAAYSSDEYFGMLKNVETPVLDFLNVKYILTDRRESLKDPKYKLVYFGRDGRIYRNDASMPRFFAVREVVNEFDDMKRIQMLLEHREWTTSAVVKRLPSGVIAVAKKDLFRAPKNAPLAHVSSLQLSGKRFRVSIDAPRWTLIVSSEPNVPGWKVYREGERLKVIEVDEAFVGFLVPPGRSVVDVVYRPMSFTVGAFVAGMTLLLLLIWPLLRRGFFRPQQRELVSASAAPDNASDVE